MTLIPAVAFALTRPGAVPVPSRPMKRADAPGPIPGFPSAAAARPLAAFAFCMSMPMCASSALSQEGSGHEAGRRM